MTKFRALLGALATGTLILAITQPAYAASSENDITGITSVVDGACVAPTAFFSGLDCTYNNSSPWLGVPTSAWQGPGPTASYYQVGQSPFVQGAVGDEPVVGDTKYNVPILSGSTITIEDNSSVCNADDQISGTIVLGAATRAYSGGPGSRGEESWGDGDVIFPIPVTTVSKATADGAGGCNYEIASAGFPPLLQSVNGGTYIFDAEIVPAPPLPGEDSWDGPATVGVGCSLAQNCGVAVAVIVGPGWQCADNTGGSGACATDQGHYGGNRVTLENFLIAVSTNGNGDITSGTIFANNEENVAVSILPDPNSWDGPLLTFAGTCNNCSLVRDDNYTVVEGSATTDLNIGANDAITGDTTVVITDVPDKGGTADPVNNNGGPVQAITVSYKPAAAAPETETFVYSADNGTDNVSATVTVTIEVDSEPVAEDFDRLLDTEGVDPSTLSDSFNALTEGGNEPGNGGVVSISGAAGRGAASTNDTDVTYVPFATFFSGSDTYMYTITDDQDEAATGTVTVLIPDVDPVADDAIAETEADVSVDVLIGFDLGNGALAQHTATAIAGNGTCTVNLATATATYEPDSGFSGDDTCTYTLADGDGSSDDGFIIITVEDTLAIKFPSGNALDPWSLALLIGLPLLRRRRRSH